MESIDLAEPLFEPQSLNIEFIFEKVYAFLKPIFNFIIDPQTWSVIGTISIISTIFFLAVIIFSIVRLREMQLQDKADIDHQINESLKRQIERQKGENPRWHHILSLTESGNESDWRVAIMEADSLMEESLKEKGIPGSTVAELLEAARSDGYSHIQSAWDAHLIRNQIAHQGSEFPLSQVEARRVIKMFQNFFDDLGII